MMQSVLAYQFVDGLRPELKVKLAGSDGTFDQLLAKARFQEARLRDVPPTKGSQVQPRSSSHPPKPASRVTGTNSSNQLHTPTKPSRVKCFMCEGV